jgi:hypothetical protein
MDEILGAHRTLVDQVRQAVAEPQERHGAKPGFALK